MPLDICCQQLQLRPLSAAGSQHTHSCARLQPLATAGLQRRPLTTAAKGTATLHHHDPSAA